MKVVIVKKYYFESKDKIRFKKWLLDQDITLNEFANDVGLSMSYLNFILSGDRPMNKELVIKFQNQGFNVVKKKLQND